MQKVGINGKPIEECTPCEILDIPSNMNGYVIINHNGRRLKYEFLNGLLTSVSYDPNKSIDD